MGCWNTHASGTLDPPEVRNWYIHLIAAVASMSALASKISLIVVESSLFTIDVLTVLFAR